MNLTRVFHCLRMAENSLLNEQKDNLRVNGALQNIQAAIHELGVQQSQHPTPTLNIDAAAAQHLLATAQSAVYLMTVPPHKRDGYTLRADGTLEAPSNADIPPHQKD